MELPSGRFLYYLRPRLRVETFVSKRTGKSYDKTVLSYEGYDDKKYWTRVDTWGGKFIENWCQAWARDILAEGMILADRKGFLVLGSVHDELITLVKEEKKEIAVPLLVKCMSRKPDWHHGIVLDAEGFHSPYYRK
jgi:DNA polymerase